jgi:acetyl esterase
MFFMPDLRTALSLLLLSGLAAGRLSAVETATQPAGDDPLAGAQAEVYKTVGDTRLKVHIFTPEGHRPASPRPAIVFFFGGGWFGGSVNQFAPHCRRLAAQGMVAMVADYRVYSRHRARVMDCAADAQSAIRWVRANAKRLGIDPNRIAAGGGSAGGHLAACTAMTRDFTTAEDPSISFRPNALVLFNPALDLRTFERRRRNNRERSPAFRDRLGAEAETLSPAAQVKPGLPPALIFHGKADTTIPYAEAEKFTEEMQSAGNRCTLVGYEGQGHGFFNAHRRERKYFEDTYRRMQDFLAALGYLRPTGNYPATRDAGGR